MFTYRNLATQLCAGVLCLSAAQLALASTAANTRITNEVTVTWQNASGSVSNSETAAVALTINLVPALPSIVLGQATPIDAATEDTRYDVLYTVTATANGPDSYAIEINDTPEHMGANAVLENAPYTISLGATTLAVEAKSGDLYITVPYDQDNAHTTNNSVNGITEGSTLLIGEDTYTVSAIDRSATYDETTNTVQIALTSPIDGNDVPVGTIVGEQQEITLQLHTDFIVEGQNTGSHKVTPVLTSATNNDTSGEGGESSIITLNIHKPLLTINKYARNITTSSFNQGSAAYTVAGVNYFDSDITGNPGDTIEYIIVIDNSHQDSGPAGNVIVKDTIPPFTELVDNSIFLAENTTSLSNADFIGPLTAVVDGDAARVTNNRLYVYAGEEGIDNEADHENEGGGDLPQGSISLVRFHLEIQ